jgi:tRNA splicing ligase
MSSSSDHELIKSLYALAEKNKKLVHPNQQKSPTHPDVTLTSWKMNEFKYYDIPSPFPTLARGLFTQKNENGEYRIVVRGYDKFFNIGEVPWNTVSLCLSRSTIVLTLIAVGRVGAQHHLSVHSDAQVKWMYHLHGCPHA